ncbi:DUF1203 domain-containing protein [Paucibacter sp. B2R-40]|uniref:DUF1203 domain-containing protein n=1 Tax=Paucibacter sp. B2R-40 TaxID=2893554 RepID=UPI0021E35A9B|nr:DUF1203 domain-containing protein [Paucibacter sp. B2R-40]MCV2352866.1 DUF1203 domain-containing protein [Paucibacter sp. B2R-40]
MSCFQFQIEGLPAAEFTALFGLNEAVLHSRHIQRRIVAEAHDAPCRVSLLDAEPGEEVLLLPFAHHALATPYRSSGPIFVRRAASTAQLQPGEVPDSLRRRLLALRAYDAAGWMLACEVVQGDQLEPLLERLLILEGSAFVNLHYARAGCYAARASLAQI